MNLKVYLRKILSMWSVKKIEIYERVAKRYGGWDKKDPHTSNGSYREGGRGNIRQSNGNLEITDNPNQ